MKLIHFFEKIDDMEMGDVIKDFYKSDAKQFKGKSKKKKRQMAIAAKLSADEGVEESGCLGKQIKKGKAKKKSESIEESFKHYIVKHKSSGKEYKVTAMSDNSAKEKARAQHGGTASRYTGTSTSDFEIVESIQEQYIALEEMDMPDVSDDMIGTPDDYYDEEERKEAYKDMINAMDDCRSDYEREGVIDGVCPNCAGTGYQDGEEEIYNDETDEYEEGNECDGYGMHGCDQGQMQDCSWTEIIKHDKRNAERQKSKDSYPGDEEVVDQIARAVKQLDDPRQMYQYMQADFPHMGRAQRSNLIARGMKKAGLTSESFEEDIDLVEGEERQMIEVATINWLVNYFEDRVHEMDSMEELGTHIYDELSYLDLEDIGLEDAETGGQPIKDFHNGRVIDVLDSGAVIDDVLGRLDLSELEDRDPVFPEIYKDEPFKKQDKDKSMGISDEEQQRMQDYLDKKQQDEGTIDQTFATDNIDKHDKKSKGKEKEDSKRQIELELLKKLSGIKEAPYADDEKAGAAQVLNYRGKQWKFDPARKIFTALDGEEASVTTNTGKELMLRRQKELMRTQPSRQKGYVAPEKKKQGFMSRLFNDVNEDAEGDASEVAVSKMIAKALGDENRWTEMSAAELYAELESENTDMADIVKDVAKMIYGVKLAEAEKTLYHDSSECGCKCGKPVCAACGRPHHPKDIKEHTLEDDQDFHEEYGVLGYSEDEENTFEAEYQGRKVKLNKPMRGDVKKFKVYVKDPKTGNVKKVNFGHGGTSAKRKTMRIRKSNPKARKSFRARHNCDNPGPKTKARYWSCRKW